QYPTETQCGCKRMRSERLQLKADEERQSIEINRRAWRAVADEPAAWAMCTIRPKECGRCHDETQRQEEPGCHTERQSETEAQHEIGGARDQKEKRWPGQARRLSSEKGHGSIDHSAALIECSGTGASCLDR